MAMKKAIFIMMIANSCVAGDFIRQEPAVPQQVVVNQLVLQAALGNNLAEVFQQEAVQHVKQRKQRIQKNQNHQRTFQKKHSINQPKPGY